jgi:hypothetical protein
MVIIATISEDVMLVLPIKEMYQVEMASFGMIYKYVQSFMTIGIHVEEILRFCFRNLKGSNVGITGGRIYELCR